MSDFTASKKSKYKYTIPLFLFLIAAGLAGNHFKFQLFLNIDFLFGSIFAMLALQIFGLRSGILAAALISGYTYFLWNHPYAIIIMTAEVAAVGWLTVRYRVGLVVADTLYWLVIGMPLVYVFYHLVMHAPAGNVTMIITKQAVNGITNALIARLIFVGTSFRFYASRASYKEVLYNLLAFFVLCPSLLMLAIDSRAALKETELNIHASLLHEKQRTAQTLNNWFINRKSSVINLAELAATRSPQQIQPYLEAATRSDVNYLRIGLFGKNAISAAYFPLVDEMGHSNLGKDFSDRPYITRLKKTLKPTLSDAMVSRIGKPEPIVVMLAPIVTSGEYNGYVAGTLNLEQIRESLANSTNINAMRYTLLDRNDDVIMSNRTDLVVMKPFVRDKGVLSHLDDQIDQWAPTLPPNTPAYEAWKKSFYSTEFTTDELSGWKIVLEQPVAPYQSLLYNQYSGKLTLLFIVFLCSLVLAEILSQRLISTFNSLLAITHDLPHRLTTDNSKIVWPQSGLEEPNHLINNFKQMAESLTTQFANINEINASLEQRVEKRTIDFKKSEEQLRFMLETCPTAARIARLGGREMLFYNTRYLALSETTPEDLIDLDPSTYYASQEVYADLRSRLSRGEQIIDQLAELKKPGAPQHGSKWALASYLIIEYQGGPAVLAWFHEITERIRMDRLKSEFISTVSHELRTPLTSISGALGLIAGGVLGEIPSKAHQLVEVAHRNSLRLTFLINDLLDMEKLVSGKMHFNIQRHSLTLLLEQAIEANSTYQSERHIKLSLTGTAAGIELKVDSQRLLQVLSNLLSNAIKYSPDDGEVEIGVKTQNGSVRVSVTDHGTGIPAEFRDRIFQKFAQADSSDTRQKGGTGLGLAITRELVEGMGGKIGYESTPGEGSCFYFDFPAA